MIDYTKEELIELLKKHPEKFKWHIIDRWETILKRSSYHSRNQLIHIRVRGIFRHNQITVSEN